MFKPAAMPFPTIEPHFQYCKYTWKDFFQVALNWYSMSETEEYQITGDNQWDWMNHIIPFSSSSPKPVLNLWGKIHVLSFLQTETICCFHLLMPASISNSPIINLWQPRINDYIWPCNIRLKPTAANGSCCGLNWSDMAFKGIICTMHLMFHCIIL